MIRRTLETIDKKPQFELGTTKGLYVYGRFAKEPYKGMYGWVRIPLEAIGLGGVLEID